MEIGKYRISELSEIRAALETVGVVIISGAVDRNLVEQTRVRLISKQWVIPHAATVGESPSDVMNNFVKVNIGGVFNTRIYRPRFLKAFYSPLWAEDVFGIHDLGRVYMFLRNRILGLGEAYATDKVEDGGVWTALRIQHYPRGGGFLVPHRDTVISTTQNWSGIRDFIQMLLPLSKKGVDYFEGGGHVDIKGKRVLVDDQCEQGDVVVYSGMRVHGVQEIDPHMPFDMDVSFGRQVMMCSFYRDLALDRLAYKRLQPLDGIN